MTPNNKAFPLLILLSALTWLDASNTLASKYSQNLGVGVTLGEPTGLTARKWVSETYALSGGLSYSFDDFVILTADYVRYVPGLFDRMASDFTRDLYPTLGIGGVIALSGEAERPSKIDRFGDGIGFGIRLPFGAEWRPVGTQVGVSLEFSPGIALVPATYFFFQGGLALRYYLN